MIWQAPEIWDGDCFIIGGGHSIAKTFNVPDNLIPLHQEEFVEFGNYLKPYLKDKQIIGVNLSAFLGDWVDVAYWGDSDTYLQYKSWYDNFSGLKVSSAGKFAVDKYKSIKFLEKNHKKGICTNGKSLTWAGFNSGAAAINLGYCLGAKRIFMLGFDMQSLPDGRVHWHAGYPDKKENFTNKDLAMGKVPKRSKTQPPYKRQINGFGPVAEDAKKLGLEIINLSPGSKIKEFPVASFWDYFEKPEKLEQKEKPLKKDETIKIDTKAPESTESENLAPKNELNPVNFVCVLKSGGDYDSNYVYRLFNGIQRNFTKEFSFHCLTDVRLNRNDINEIPLKHDWPGWWSKIEIFRPGLFKGFSVFFDLDTVILDNIELFVGSVKDISFGGLRGFNQARRIKANYQNFASGIMVGKFGIKDEVYLEFKKNPGFYMHKYSSYAMNWKRGDQGMIADVLDEKKINKIQDYLPENYIVGKRATRSGKERVPNSHILAWSGKPRLHTLNQGWIYDEWTKG
jgi:hypothetical protein